MIDGGPPAPDVAAQFQRALGFHRQGRLAEAEALYRAVLDRSPTRFDALHLLGVIHSQKNQHEIAAGLIERAIAISPYIPVIHSNLGLVLQALGRQEDALVRYDRAIALDPNFADAHNNRGTALQRLNRVEEALASYERALQLQPNHVDALNNRGSALRDLMRLEESVASYNRALQLMPNFSDALRNRGNALRQLGRHGDAARSFEQLLAVSPGYDYALGNMFFARLHACDWTDYDALAARIADGVERGERCDRPFSFLTHSNSPAAQLRCAQIYVADRYKPAAKAVWAGEPYPHDKIRIAYLSADFHAHATAFLMAGLFETHDRTRFEIYALSFGPHDEGDMRDRLKRSFHRFVDVRRMSDRAVAQMLKDFEIDIAVDLKGLTGNSRPGIFAHRGAPLQVAYLGFPATTGTDYIDYIIADAHVVPPGHERHYSEKVVRLPDTYQVNDRNRRTAEATPARAELGLPQDGFVFACFNNSYKITPSVFGIWMRLLKRVAGSVLWLLEDNAEAAHNLRLEAEKWGVPSGRLRFAPRCRLEEHLARHRQADLFLDTMPCNAHTGASDALWAGLPLVTCMGDTFASRVAGSLLHAVGLPELITHNPHAYEALALKLATDQALLAEIKGKLARNRATCPLFDTERFRRHIEAAYVAMHQRHLRGEPPAGFDVSPIES